jgi:hypothetical protein
MNIDVQGVVFFSPSFIPRFYDAISIIVVFYLTVVKLKKKSERSYFTFSDSQLINILYR